MTRASGIPWSTRRTLQAARFLEIGNSRTGRNTSINGGPSMSTFTAVRPRDLTKSRMRARPACTTSRGKNISSPIATTQSSWSFNSIVRKSASRAVIRSSSSAARRAGSAMAVGLASSAVTRHPFIAAATARLPSPQPKSSTWPERRGRDRLFKGVERKLWFSHLSGELLVEEKHGAILQSRPHQLPRQDLFAVDLCFISG